MIRGSEEREETVMHRFTSEVEVSSSVILYGPIEAILQPYMAVGQELTAERERTLLDALKHATEKVGNVVDAGGKPFSPDLLLEALERIWIEFDESGKPVMPTIVAGEAAAAQIASLKDDTFYKDKFEQLMQRKKAEWLAREANRTLVG